MGRRQSSRKSRKEFEFTHSSSSENVTSECGVTGIYAEKNQSIGGTNAFRVDDPTRAPRDEEISKQNLKSSNIIMIINNDANA